MKIDWSATRQKRKSQSTRLSLQKCPARDGKAVMNGSSKIKKAMRLTTSKDYHDRISSSKVILVQLHSLSDNCDVSLRASRVDYMLHMCSSVTAAKFQIPIGMLTCQSSCSSQFEKVSERRKQEEGEIGEPSHQMEHRGDIHTG